MTEPENKRFQPAQTADSAESAPLVQPEGVNAGSADELTDDAPQTSQPHTSQSQTAQTQASKSAVGQSGRQADDLIGAPGDDAREPSREHGSSGQDAGSMD